MRLPSFKRIFKADFPPEVQAWIDRMAFIINNGIEVLYDVLNHKVSLADNILSVVKDVTVTVDNNGIPANAISVSLDNIVTKVIGVSVISAQNQTNSAIYPSSGVFINGTQNANSFQITHITGLQANNSYLIRIIVWG